MTHPNIRLESIWLTLYYRRWISRWTLGLTESPIGPSLLHSFIQ